LPFQLDLELFTHGARGGFTSMVCELNLHG
jgi:hypothetical protein